jgi:hypothetical protein
MGIMKAEGEISQKESIHIEQFFISPFLIATKKIRNSLIILEMPAG